MRLLLWRHLHGSMHRQQATAVVSCRSFLATKPWQLTCKLGVVLQEPFERWAELPSRYGAKCLGM